MRKVHLECKPDETLAKSLGVPQRQIVHHNDKGRVLLALSRAENETGIIDEDPHSSQPSLLKNFSQTLQEDSSLKIARDSNNNKLIILKPRLEEWLLECSGRSGVSMKGFKNMEGKAIHKEINSKLPQLHSFVSELLLTGYQPIISLKNELHNP
jgi:hypothetical protein